MRLSKVHVVLDAVQFATESDVSSFTQLVRTNSSVLQLELVLRILLTFLPESTEPSKYIPLLKGLRDGGNIKQESSITLLQPSKSLSNEEAKRRIRRLRLLPLRHVSIESEVTDQIERFLFCRAYRIDEEVGSLELVQELVKPFVKQYEYLAIWATSAILPLKNIEASDTSDVYALSLDGLQQLRGRAGLDVLLPIVIKDKGYDYSKQLRTIVGPWMLGQAPNSSKPDSKSSEARIRAWSTAWKPANEWLLDLASTDCISAVISFKNWNGPADIDYGGWYSQPEMKILGLATAAYEQLGLALFWMMSNTNHEREARELLEVTSARTGLNFSPELNSVSFSTYQSRLPDVYLTSISNIHLTPGELLDSANPLTTPSDHALQYANLVLISAELLRTFDIDFTVGRTTSLALFASGVDQWSICSKAIHNLPSKCGKDDKLWTDARERLLWLKDWKTSVEPGQTRQGIFSQVVLDDLHTSILESFVRNGRYKLAIDIYCRSSPPLSQAKVKDALINVILAAYDNSSNGNKTRGGIKKAAEVITAFQPHFPGFQRLATLTALIQATHRLSFYALALQHGVPLLPVNIRIHPEPLTLIDKVLEQNPGSYTKLDDLLDIGRDLVRAGRITFDTSNGPPLPEAEALLQVEQAITAKAISASLSEDDFDTAYSYIVNRLSTITSVDSSASNDHLWQAAYQAGKFTSHTKTTTSPSALRRLEQRMELLSQALLLAPASSLQEVLSTWETCEEELNDALAQESQQENAWHAKGDRILPGGFTREETVPVATKARESTRRAMDEEAPMGLFDVARGAAAALSKSAFPLRGGAERTSNEIARDDEDTPQRMRKRDMVSNMVTGGLASGIGWVIGAPPVKHDG